MIGHYNFMSPEFGANPPQASSFQNASKRSGSGKVPPGIPAERQRKKLFQNLKLPPEIGVEEVEAHFRGMPSRYWERVSEAELVWGLETIHRFYRQLAEPNSTGNMPVLDWKRWPGRKYTSVMLCTWDRPGLLANAAGAFSELGIDILHADVHTRGDYIALDTFRVGGLEKGRMEEALRRVAYLMEGAWSVPPRFATYWAFSKHKFFPNAGWFEAALCWNTTGDREHTILTLETPNRLGLLYDIFHAFAEQKVNVAHAEIETKSNLARDVFYLTDMNGNKLAEASSLNRIEASLRAALAPEAKE
jgi:[protein-PII] uridylyltransferase